MTDDAEACKRIREGSSSAQRAFAAELKRMWRQREERAGEMSPLARAFGTCDVKLARFYEAGDFAVAYRAAMEAQE